MKNLHSEITIAASPEAVWKVLSDFAAYPAWNPFIINISGKQTEGEKLAVMLRPPEKSPMTFKPRILKWKEYSEFRWLGRVGIRGVFDGEHYFQLEPTDDGETRFIHGENFSGILLPLLWGSLKSNTFAGFEAMNIALKEVVESGILSPPDVTE